MSAQVTSPEGVEPWYMLGAISAQLNVNGVLTPEAWEDIRVRALEYRVFLEQTGAVA